MQRLRSTFKRSRTPTGAEMKSQSSLEVPKQVRSASFDEIQLEVQRQESSQLTTTAYLQQQAGAAELRSIANLAMVTSSGGQNLQTSSSSSINNVASSTLTTIQQQSSSSFVFDQGPRNKLSNLRVPQLAGGQRSRSFDVASSTDRPTTSSMLLDRSSSSAGTYVGYVTRWRSSGERDNPPAQAYSCWHCACLDEWRLQQGRASDSWEDEDPDEQNQPADEGDEGDDEDDGDYYYDSNSVNNSQQCLFLQPPAPPSPGGACNTKLERDTGLYFVILQKASEDAEDEGSDCSRREGSPEIRLTLTSTTDDNNTSSNNNNNNYFTSTSFNNTTRNDYCSTSSGEQPPPLPIIGDGDGCLLPISRQRRRSLSRQEALTVYPVDQLPVFNLEDVSARHQSSSDEDQNDKKKIVIEYEESQQQSKEEKFSSLVNEEVDETVDEDDDQGSDGGPISKPGQLVVRDIFLTVPDLKRDRAASVDSCFNNNKNGSIESGYSLQVPQQSARSKSVDIVLPTEAQTRYTALLPPGGIDDYDDDDDDDDDVNNRRSTTFPG